MDAPDVVCIDIPLPEGLRVVHHGIETSASQTRHGIQHGKVVLKRPPAMRLSGKEQADFAQLTLRATKVMFQFCGDSGELGSRNGHIPTTSNPVE